MTPLPTRKSWSYFEFGCVVALLCALPAYAQTEIFGIAQLMQNMARIEQQEANFHEQKILSLLSEPLTSSGTLRYRRPNYVERLTLSPRRERFVYENGKVTVGNDTRQRQFQADNDPSLGAFIESMRATLAGDEKGLRRHYALRLSGASEKWILELTPLESALASRIRLLRISGVQNNLKQIDILEVSGDRTVMTIDVADR
jgi:outer membrane lipoprotein-sorting protein